MADVGVIGADFAKKRSLFSVIGVHDIFNGLRTKISYLVDYFTYDVADHIYEKIIPIPKFAKNHILRIDTDELDRKIDELFHEINQGGKSGESNLTRADGRYDRSREKAHHDKIHHDRADDEIIRIDENSEEYKIRSERLKSSAFTFDEITGKEYSIGEIKIYVSAFKEIYQKDGDFDKSIDDLRKRYGIDEKILSEMTRQTRLHRKRLNSNIAGRVLPNLFAVHEIKSTSELVKISVSGNIGEELSRRGIEANEENAKELYSISKVLGSKNKNLERFVESVLLESYNLPQNSVLRSRIRLDDYFRSSKSENLESKFELNKNPSEGQLMKAVMEYSNLLNGFQNRDNSPGYSNYSGQNSHDCSIDSVDHGIHNRTHNKICDISGKYGIKASKIRYMAKKLEKNIDVQKYRIETFGYSTKDLTKDMICGIYSDKMSGATYEEIVLKYNLSSRYAAKKAVNMAGDEHFAEADEIIRIHTTNPERKINYVVLNNVRFFPSYHEQTRTKDEKIMAFSQ